MPNLDILCWTHVGYRGRTGGHAAIIMDGSVESADSAHNASQKTYISWWPGGPGKKRGGHIMRPGEERTLLSDVQNEMGDGTRQGLQAGTFQPRPGQVSLLASQLDLSSGPLSVLDYASQQEHQDFIDECTASEDSKHNQFVQFPTEIISLHADSEGELGLNARAMLAWWKAFRLAHKHELVGRKSGYKFLSTKYNCASIVMRALIAGEAAFFKKPPTQWVWMSPRDVADYAEELKTRIIRANNDYDQYFNSKLAWQGRNRREMHMHPPTVTTELPTVDQWKQMSNTNVTFAAISRRREQNAEIDRLLALYHAQQPWDAGGADYRLVYMAEIFKQIGSYIAVKPKGDRLNAMLALGQIVLAVREAKAAAIDVGFFD